jgi:hypothetical protein
MAAKQAHFNWVRFQLLLTVNRAFSADVFLFREPWGAAPASAVNAAPLALERFPVNEY